MWAPRSSAVDRHPAERTISLGRVGDWLDEDLRDPPGDKSDDDEVDRGGDKVSNTKFYRADAPRRFLPLATGADCNPDRHDEIFDERLDERGERGGYHDRYRQRHNVLFE